jgi:hypothetical protein
MILSLSSCGEKSVEEKSVELTVDNISQYLAINAVVTDCNVETDSGSVGGLYYENYNGDATVQIKVVNQSGAKFENVIIECELKTFVDCYPACHGWEFNTGNKNSGEESSLDTNTKTIQIILPYDGNWDDTEYLTLEMYDEGHKFITAPWELSNCYINIVSVTGTVVGGKPNIPNADTKNDEPVMSPRGEE